MNMQLDFLALAEAYPSLRPHIIQTSNGAVIDFKNDISQRRLTEAILHRDFDIELSLPPDRLCPPIPNRLNYILWLGDVMNTVSLATASGSGTSVVRVLDVGTGASAIYPLLGCRIHPNWIFTGTDIDARSLAYAHMNVKRNKLEHRISVAAANPADPIFSSLYTSKVKFDFTMCNPPFYSSREEVIRSAEAKDFGPNAVCTGANVEMIVPGGEVAFVKRMVQESLELRNKCIWFTSMVGKMTSLTYIVSALRENKVDNYVITELVQGRTRRWVIAWSFDNIRLPDSIGRLSHPGLQNIMPARNTLRQPLTMAKHTIKEAAPILNSVIASIDGLSIVNSTEQSGNYDVLVSANGDSWSRAARRRKKGGVQVDDVESADVQLVCRIQCEVRDKVASTGADDAVDMALIFDWLAGNDRGLFESFASHVKRKAAGDIRA